MKSQITYTIEEKDLDNIFGAIIEARTGSKSTSWRALYDKNMNRLLGIEVKVETKEEPLTEDETLNSIKNNKDRRIEIGQL